MMRAIFAAGAMASLLSAAAQAEPFDAVRSRQPFVATLSNNIPLAFGMDAEQTARALGQPLQYVRGRPGNEIYLALRNIGGSGLIPYRHRLFLQFRHGRLAGWKEDYGENWMWE
ncbi:hypothetical protein [Bradyrhizobium sp. 141]|uniref:hypothetical protein n=1 Tax=Bradyrhizobium sp. 141 TaxID=2782617 RepID=UPI001FFACAC5|nr:hypothetical protein [Bradyrhizobium sp. 141]MCK1717667.1 hypothetical protein [Bradyrhizobium sp. 141]